jgi:hypothetical protein
VGVCGGGYQREKETLEENSQNETDFFHKEHQQAEYIFVSSTFLTGYYNFFENEETY